MAIATMMRTGRSFKFCRLYSLKMNPSIPLFDIPAQHASIKDELRKAILQVLDSHHYILGREGAEFEKEFAQAAGAAFAEGVSSGTSALHLAVQALDLKPGSGVMTVPFTFIGTTIGILSAGATI